MARLKRLARRKREIMPKNKQSQSGKWIDMQYDVLLKIFATFNIMDVILRFSTVCRSWRTVCCDPLLWKNQILDLSVLNNYFDIPAIQSFWLRAILARRLMLILQNAIHLSCGNISTLIFHFYICVRDDHLIYAAQRCPNIKKLVLPAANIISTDGFQMAIRSWQELESLTVPCINSPYYIITSLGEHCKNFSKLKVMSPFDLEFATSITTSLPRLKVLSLRCAIVHMNALDHILDNLKHLEVLNLSHCLFICVCPITNRPRYVYHNLIPFLLEKASKLQEFYKCEYGPCTICHRTFIDDDGTLAWHEYDDELWRRDEVTSLAY